MGPKIAIGRDFDDTDEQSQENISEPDGRPIEQTSTKVILSYEYWQRRYGGNTAIIRQLVYLQRVAAIRK